MKNNLSSAIISGLVSGLLVSVSVALIYVTSVSASLGDMRIPLPSIGPGVSEREFVAPYTGEAFIEAEFETTGECIWGGILISHETNYVLTVDQPAVVACKKSETLLSSMKVVADAQEIDPDHAQDDNKILCHLKEFDARPEGAERPSGIRFACPVMKFTHGDTYFVRSYVTDKEGTVIKSHEIEMRYTYRRSRFW